MKSIENSKRKTISAIDNSVLFVSKLSMKSTSSIAAKIRAGFVPSAKVYASVQGASDKTH
jgi:hypothetical protein